MTAIQYDGRATRTCAECPAWQIVQTYQHKGVVPPMFSAALRVGVCTCDHASNRGHVLAESHTACDEGRRLMAE